MTTVTLDQGFVVRPEGKKTFGSKSSGFDGSTAYYHYDLGGKFTSKSAFSGTLTVKGDAGRCSGVSQFSLKKA